MRVRARNTEKFDPGHVCEKLLRVFLNRWGKMPMKGDISSHKRHYEMAYGISLNGQYSFLSVLHTEVTLSCGLALSELMLCS